MSNNKNYLFGLVILSLLLGLCNGATKHVDVQLNKNVPVIIPPGSTQAVYCHVVPFDNEGKPWQITRFDTIVNNKNEDNIAFIILWGIRAGAKSPLLNDLDGTYPNCYGLEYAIVFQKKMDYISFWKYGMNGGVQFSNDEGMPFGNQTDYTHFMIQVSYTSLGTSKTNFTDDSGFTIRLTDKVRPKNVAFLTLGMDDGLFKIPTLQSYWAINSSTVVDSNYMLVNQDPEFNILYNLKELFEGLNVSNAQVIFTLGHTMGYGTSVDIYQWKNGTAPGNTKTYSLYGGIPVVSGSRYSGVNIGTPVSLGHFDKPLGTTKSWLDLRDDDLFLTGSDSVSVTCAYNTIFPLYGQWNTSNPINNLPCHNLFGTDCEMCNGGVYISYEANNVNSAKALNPLLADPYRVWANGDHVVKEGDYGIFSRDTHPVDLKSFNTTKYPVWVGYGEYTDKTIYPVLEDQATTDPLPVVWTHNEDLERAFINHTVNLHWFFKNYSVIWTPSFNRWWLRTDYTFYDWLQNFRELGSVSSDGLSESDVGGVNMYVGPAHDPHGCPAKRSSVFVQELKGNLAGIPWRWIWDVSLNTTLSNGYHVETIVQQATWLKTIEHKDLSDSWYDWASIIPSTVEYRTNFTADFTCLWTLENQRKDILVGK